MLLSYAYYAFLSVSIVTINMNKFVENQLAMWSRLEFVRKIPISFRVYKIAIIIHLIIHLSTNSFNILLSKLTYLLVFPLFVSPIHIARNECVLVYWKNKTTCEERRVKDKCALHSNHTRVQLPARVQLFSFFFFKLNKMHACDCEYLEKEHGFGK